MQKFKTYLPGLEQLTTELEHPLSSPTTEKVVYRPSLQVSALAADLAEKAYVHKETNAKEMAERMLYLIHVTQNFSPPLREIPYLIWGVLIRAKMDQALQLGSPIPSYSIKKMRTELEQLIQNVDQQDHPLIDEVTAADDLRGLMVYTKNWFAMTHGFTNQLISLLQRCTGTIKKVVWENVADELQDNEQHEKLRKRFLKSIGINFEPMKALQDQDYLSESMAVLNFRTAVCTLKNPFFALGSFYSIEASYPLVCKRLVQGLRARGFDEHSIESFTLHAEADTEHAEEWLKCIEDSSLTDQERGYVVAGAKAQVQARHELFEAIKRYSTC